MTLDPGAIGAVVGAAAYAAAHGVFRAWAEHRRREGSTMGPRLEKTQRRVARIEGILGIKEDDDDETPTPTIRRPRH
jgi:hypothetical protein